MANIQTVKAQKAEKTLRLLTILLLVIGIAAIAVAVYDWVSESSLLTLFDAPAAEESAEAAATVDTQHGGLTVAYVMLIVAGLLLVIGSIMHLVKNNYRAFQASCIAAIIFALFPLIFFAVSIGAHLFALIYALIALAIIVLAIFAMKSRWQIYIKEMTGEVKKLTWLSMKELVKATAVVLAFVLAFAVLIYVLDLAFYAPVKAALNHSPASATEEVTDETAAPETADETPAPETDDETPAETDETEEESSENNG